MSDQNALPGTSRHHQPLASYRPVAYPAAVVAGSRHVQLGEAFIEFLVGREGQAILARLGFQPISGGGR